MFVNGLGAVATGITVVVVLVAKFAEGAWITALLIATDDPVHAHACSGTTNRWRETSISTGPLFPPMSPSRS